MVTQYCGGIAQLGERLNGIQEVSGSIPLTSTNKLSYETRNLRFERISRVLLKILGTQLEKCKKMTFLLSYRLM